MRRPRNKRPPEPAFNGPLPENPPGKLADRIRFEEACYLQKGTGCWIWRDMASCRAGNHGPVIRLDGVPVRAQQAAWLLYRGPVPYGMRVMSDCNNRLECVNPAHMIVGTINHTARTSMARAGSRNAILTEDEVRKIRHLAANGTSQAELAPMFRVSKACICDIINRKTWRYVA